MDNDYYQILGVGRNANKEEIKKAYKEYARKHHPDKGGDAELFKKINEAYRVLGDDDLKLRYDQFGKSGIEGADLSSFPDFFDMFPFPVMMRRTQNRTTPDRRLSLEISMEEAFSGCSIKYRYKRKVFVGNATLCEKCRGQGQIAERMPISMGIIQNIRVCDACTGTGTTMAEKDFQTITEIVNVDVPSHCYEGFQIIIHGKSDEIPKMQTGNVILSVVIRPHPVFSLVAQRHLLWKIRVHPFEALTTFSKEATLPSGEIISIKHLPPNNFLSSLDQWKVIQGKGLFGHNGQRGDLLLSFQLEDYYLDDKTANLLFQSCDFQSTPVNIDVNSIPIQTLQLIPPITSTSEQQQSNHQQPHVQECRQS